MKGKAFLTGLIFLYVFGLTAQNPVCVPNPIYADSSAGVYPLPYHEVLFPDEGIQDTVCIGQDFEYTFTAVLKDSISWMGFSFILNSLEIMPSGVLNLPQGLQYGCNPPNCVFLANTMGCLKIFGTASETNDPGLFDLQLRTKIVVANGLISVIDTLPKLLIPGAHYYLPVEAADSGYCQTASQHTEIQHPAFEMIHYPGLKRITILMKDPHVPWVVTEIIDLTGRVLAVKRHAGPQFLPLHLDVSELNAGLYFVRVLAENGFSSQKFIAGY